jgi:arylsulfatase A-like enzyme
MSTTLDQARFRTLLICLGLLGGAGAAAFRVWSAGTYLHVWGRLEFLDLPILVLAGGVAGFAAWVLLAISGPWILGATARTVRLVTIVLLAALSVAFVILLTKGDITTPPEAVEGRAAQAGGSGRAPDIVVIIYDAVRADVLADPSGLPPAWCPNLQALGKSSVVFRNAVAPAPWTLPSHASLFTGLTPLEHGASEETPLLRSELTTLAEDLKARGYHTAAVVANPWLGSERGFDQGFDSYLQLWDFTSQLQPLFFRFTGRFEARHWLTTEDPRFDKGARLAGVLSRRIVAGLPPSVPLFLFVNLVDAHPPYHPPQPYQRLQMPSEVDQGLVVPEAISQDWVRIFTGEASLTPVDRSVLRSLNIGEVAYMDEFLGKLLRSMQEAGRFENSLFAVTSDHGAAMGEGRRLGSGFDLREEMLRIPMIVHFPAGQQGGGVRDDLVFLQDLHPTILQLAGARGSANAAEAKDSPLDPARSLLGGIARTDGVAAYARPVNMLKNLWEQAPKFDASFLDRRMLALRGKRWKYVWTSPGLEQLFDLEGKGEAADLAAAMPDVLNDERAALAQALGAAPAEAWSKSLAAARRGTFSSGKTDEEARKVLQSLGYVGGGD